MITDTKLWTYLLDSVKDLSESYLRSFATDPAFDDKMILAFGKTSADLSTDWSAGNVVLPDIAVGSAEELNGAYGAFSQDTGKIYLSEALLESDSQELITAVFLEEYGHFIDTQLNTVDSPGDEGAIFSSLVRGKELLIDQLQQLKVEDDQDVIVFDESKIKVEKSDELSPVSISDSGGFEGSNETITLQDSAGESTVEFRYEHFLIPDNFVIRYEGRNVLETGFAGGSSSGTFDLPEGTSNQVQVLVLTDDEGTAWNYDVTIHPNPNECPETRPLSIELVGDEFEDTDENGSCEGQGEVLVGYRGTSLLRIENADVEFNDEELIVKSGTVFSNLGDIPDSFFNGSVTIPYQSATSANQVTETADGTFQLAGLDVDFSTLAFQNNGIILEMPLIPFPNEVIGRALEAVNVDLVIDSSGPRLGSTGTIPLPVTGEAEIELLGLDLEVKNLTTRYIFKADPPLDPSLEDTLLIQGNFELENDSLFKTIGEKKIVADLKRDDGIRVKDGNILFKGKLEAKGENDGDSVIELPGGFSLDQLSISIDTTGNVPIVGGDVSVGFPFTRLLGKGRGFSGIGGGIDFALTDPISPNRISLSARNRSGVNEKVRISSVALPVS